MPPVFATFTSPVIQPMSLRSSRNRSQAMLVTYMSRIPREYAFRPNFLHQQLIGTPRLTACCWSWHSINFPSGLPGFSPNIHRKFLGTTIRSNLHVFFSLHNKHCKGRVSVWHSRPTAGRSPTCLLADVCRCETAVNRWFFVFFAASSPVWMHRHWLDPSFQFPLDTWYYSICEKSLPLSFGDPWGFRPFLSRYA